MPSGEQVASLRLPVFEIGATTPIVPKDGVMSGDGPGSTSASVPSPK